MLASHTITHTRRRTWEGEALIEVDLARELAGHEALVEPLLARSRHAVPGHHEVVRGTGNVPTEQVVSK